MNRSAINLAKPEWASPKPRVFVLADDLTGAADAAVHFGGQQRVRITFPPRDPWDCDLRPETVQVFDSETRDSTADVAEADVTAACEALPAAARSAGFLYKKVDSTLRGQVGAELQAISATLGRNAVLLAPAFPANGRIVREGVLYVDGQPLAASPVASDPVNPVRFSRIADILGTTSSLRVEEIPLGLVRTSTHALTAHLVQASARGGVLVIDAETDDDLRRIARAIAGNRAIVPAGSAGLARALSAEWLPRIGATTSPAPPTCTRILVVAGSANPRSHEQLRVLSAGFPVRSVFLSAIKLADPATRAAELERVAQETRGFGEGVLALSLGQERASGNAHALAADLAQAARTSLLNARLSTRSPLAVVLTGGDTALAFCRALGIRAIWPRGELAAGVPWSDAEVDGPALTLITKAGGFGHPSILLQAVQSLTQPRAAAA